jgi:hypothetical protein
MNTYVYTLRLPRGSEHRGSIPAHHRAEARELIHAIHPGAEILKLSRQWRMPRLPEWLVYVLTIIILFGGANLLLVGAQKLWHWSDQSRLDVLKAQIAGERARLREEEGWLSQHGSEIEGLRKQIVGGVFGASMRSAVITEYTERVTSFRARYERYSSDIDAVNKKIEDANALSKKIGGTWYVIPIPGRRGTHQESHITPWR